MTRPETCAPTVTVLRAERVPVAVTWAEIGPLPTVTVEYVIGASPLAHGFLIHKNAMPPATRARVTTRGIQRFICTMPP